MKSFFDTFSRDPLTRVVTCPPDGRLPRKFKPVPVEPWEPEPRHKRGRAKRPTSVEQIEKINDSLRWDSPRPASGQLRAGEAGTDEPLEIGNDLGHVNEPSDGQFEPDEFDDWRYFRSVEAQGIRSLMQPAISSADWSWRAPAARCRSCGAVTWIASIADGIRMLSNARHRKDCTCPPSRLEVELSCA